jgi:hypothetical protein
MRERDEARAMYRAEHELTTAALNQRDEARARVRAMAAAIEGLVCLVEYDPNGVCDRAGKLVKDSQC